MMETARTSETLVNFYPTTRRNNPEDSHLPCFRGCEDWIVVFWEDADGKLLRNICNCQQDYMMS
jgi:hypothetical protein